MTKKESVISAMVLNDMGTIVKDWNHFVEESKKIDKKSAFKEVYPMSQFNALCEHLSPMEIAESITSKGAFFFSYMDKYIFMRGGKFESFNTLHDGNCPISLGWLADFIIENGDSGFTEISNNVLVKEFIYEYFPDKACNLKFFNAVMESDYDFLMDDWDDIYDGLTEEIQTT